ncbi:MAG: hypothetical protein QS748_06585 [Candidatus Endonucleobacter bathymodioli]|uniref:Uncharacterized protein n=1 Tax=Candidatus Endonucleibacter bathymodioli TaxID=539814 RepID=A0AA90NY07_9GAMM|nr:hypothetical protein [Candidatus Endonucleobacter bathymodioli]
MIFIYKYDLAKLVFSFVICLCLIGGHCHGVGRDEVYHELLAVVHDINKSLPSHAIVLHGSLAWEYIMADAHDSRIVLQDIKINDLDFFVDGTCFEEVIEMLRSCMSQLSFETRIIEYNNITWCFCYYVTGSGRVVRVADFVKLDNWFSSQDVFLIKGKKFNLSIASANWILAYEQRWLNNLEPTIRGYIDVIREEGNKWLALSGNSDPIYSIYKAFSKFDEHIAKFEEIDFFNKMPFTSNIDAQLISAKNILDNIIIDTNTFLSDSFGIVKDKKGKYGGKPSSLDHRNKKMDDAYTGKAKKTVWNIDASKSRKNIITNRKIKKKQGDSQRMIEPSDISMLSADLECKMFVSGKSRGVSGKGMSTKKRGKNILNQGSCNRGKYISKDVDGGLDDVLDVSKGLDALSISENEDTCYDSGDANPFTPSFSKQKFYKKGSSTTVNSYRNCEEYFTVTYAKIRNLVLLSILILYFGHGLSADAIINTAAIIMVDASELMFAMLSFTLNPESNWVLTLPAVYTFIQFKYKKQMRGKVSAASFGVLMSAYSSIYAYKFITSDYNKVELCPLPSWMSKIKHIPKYTYADPDTHKISSRRSSIFTPDQWITPDKLTCNNLVALDKALKSAQVEESKISECLESCGLIDDAGVSSMCYVNDWSRYQSNVHIFNLRSEYCLDRDLCVSFKPVVGTMGSHRIAGYETCCIEYGAECISPTGFLADGITKVDDVSMRLGGLGNGEYALRMFTIDGGIGSWGPEIANFPVEDMNIMLEGISATGMYSVQNIDTGMVSAIICSVNNKVMVSSFFDL